MSVQLQEATLGGGCFWCLEAVFKPMAGVLLCESGYSGGSDPKPTYEKVCAGRGGHVEVIRLRFDPQVISFDTLLDVFFTIHDPTTLNRQGNDVGTQYRSVIFYHSAEQQALALDKIATLEAKGVYGNPIVTAVEPLLNYHPAEDYHQHYFFNNPNQPYCAYVVAPKVDKALSKFGELFKN